ncbi:MAG: hypothetical protein K0Q84_1411 [Arthrobacter sp.]|nr:hypothetical protein [Arthrobacter sp.]
MISPMSQMGRSGKTAVGAFFAALGMLVLTAITLEEAVLFTFVGLLAVGYVASVAEAFARRRHLALLAGAAGTSLFIGCGMAFLRMWGLAFNESPSALGEAVSATDSDIYFYLAVAAGTLTLLVLFVAATWPARRLNRPSPASGTQRRGAPASAAARASAARSAAARSPARGSAAAARPSAQRPAARQAGARPAAQAPGAQRQPAQRPPAQRPQRKTP